MILMDLGTLKPLNSSSVVTGGVPSQSISGAKKRSDPKMVPGAEGAPQKSPSETLVAQCFLSGVPAFHRPSKSRVLGHTHRLQLLQTQV